MLIVCNTLDPEHYGISATRGKLSNAPMSPNLPKQVSSTPRERTLRPEGSGMPSLTVAVGLGRSLHAEVTPGPMHAFVAEATKEDH